MRPRRSSAKTVIFSDWQRSQRGKSIYYNVPLAPLTIRRFTTNELFILCDLNTAQKSEKIVGPFAIPTCIDDGMDDDEILDEDGEENEEI